ncbi:hypothetical protein ACFL0G_03275 [Candidatus Zixiibacteriota bacterium]
MSQVQGKSREGDQRWGRVRVQGRSSDAELHRPGCQGRVLLRDEFAL